MSEELYDIVFKGEVVKTVDLATAKLNVGKLFKMEGAKLDALFSGNTVVLKRGLNFDTASKYRVAIKKAGALVTIVEQKVERKAEQSAAGQKPPASGSKAVFGERSPQTSASTAKQNSDTSGMTIAPAGSDLIETKDRPHVVPVKVDVSGISLKDNAGDLLNETEKRKFEVRNVDVSRFDLAPAGADVLTEAERPKVTAVQVDTSGLDIAEPGTRLSEPSPAPPPAPDVSRITLVDED